MGSWSSQHVRTLRTFFVVGILCFSLMVFRVQGAQQDAHIISSTGTITSSGNLGWLHVDGRWIKDNTGKILHFVGCAEAQTSWRRDTDPYWNHATDPIPMTTEMTELGVTWVRICVTYTFWSDPALGPSYQNLIDSYVRNLTSRGVYCIISPMGDEFTNDVPSNPTPWLSFLTELVNRYRNDPGMCGISIWNEPPWPPFDATIWEQWAIFGAQAVHAANPNILIIVCAALPNQAGLDPYWTSNPIPVSNVVYDYHDYFWHYYYYSSASNHKWTNPPPDFVMSYQAGNYALAKQQIEVSFYAQYWKYAIEDNMCIMNEEFGFADGQTPGLTPGQQGYTPGTPQSIYDYFDLLNKYSIPWNYYAWSMGGYSLTDDGVNLNIVGEVWLNHLTET